MRQMKKRVASFTAAADFSGFLSLVSALTRAPVSPANSPEHTLTERNPLGGVLTGFGKNKTSRRDKLDQRFEAKNVLTDETGHHKEGGMCCSPPPRFYLVCLFAERLFSVGSVENVADSSNGRRPERLTSTRSAPVTVLRRMSPAAVRGRD